MTGYLLMFAKITFFKRFVLDSFVIMLLYFVVSPVVVEYVRSLQGGCIVVLALSTLFALLLLHDAPCSTYLLAFAWLQTTHSIFLVTINLLVE